MGLLTAVMYVASASCLPRTRARLHAPSTRPESRGSCLLDGPSEADGQVAAVSEWSVLSRRRAPAADRGAGGGRARCRGGRVCAVQGALQLPRHECRARERGQPGARVRRVVRPAARPARRGRVAPRAGLPAGACDGAAL
eukprot:scaffold94534_cov48-Phaeocystis_antarctica.AAC.1